MGDACPPRYRFQACCHLGVGDVGDPPPVRRQRRLDARRERQGLRHAARRGHGEEARVVRRRDHFRREDDRLAVGRPAHYGVGGGMGGEPLRHAALGGHREHVDVAVVPRAEGDRPPVGREERIALDPGRGGEAGRRAPSAGHGPEIAREGEDDRGPAHRGVAHEERVRSRIEGIDRLLGEEERRGEHAPSLSNPADARAPRPLRPEAPRSSPNAHSGTESANA